MTTTNEQTTGSPYERIAEHFRGRIISGELAPGDRLPPVREIASEWSVARPTADRALSTLRAEGLVTTAGRNGTIVRDRSESDVTVLVTVPDEERLDVASAESIEASPELAEQLGVPAGATVVVLRLRRSGRSERP